MDREGSIQVFTVFLAPLSAFLVSSSPSPSAGAGAAGAQARSKQIGGPRRSLDLFVGLGTRLQGTAEG